MYISQDLKNAYRKEMYTYGLEKRKALPVVWPDLYEQKEITGEYWKETTVVNSAQWTKTANTEGFVHQGIGEGYTVYARVFDYTIATSFNNDALQDIERIKGDLRKIVAGKDGWVQKGVEMEEEFYALPFNYGGLTAGYWVFNGTPESQVETDSSGDLAYDSKPAFNLTGNERSSKGGGTYYNGHALDLSPTNFKTIWVQMTTTNNRREDDSYFALLPDTLLVPGALQFTADEILESTLVPYLSVHTKNVLQGIVQRKTWQYLTDTNAWFLLQKQQGLVALRRQEPKYNFFEDEKNRCAWATGEMRMGLMFRDWRYLAGSNFSTA